MALNIKATLKRENLTSIEVAERMGISTVGLSQHINGNPSVEVLERIAKAIGVDVSELFDRPDTGNSFCCPHCKKTITVKIG